MKGMGLLCQSDISTAVCVPGDPRPMIVPRRQERKHSGDQSNLLDLKSNYNNTDRKKLVAVTLSMVTKNDINHVIPPVPQTNHHPRHLQVVVMKVSIHCQGCARKVSKHISRIEGVVSFSIDLESKKLTVMGHVSPTQLMESISRVNVRAELIN